MRCEDLTRELASPTGRLSQAEMAGHLAHCPSCAEWSRRAAHFDQIWEATRPPEPSEAKLDALWAGASVAIDARLVPSTLRLEGLTDRRRSWVKPGFKVAQAAAILVAAVFLFRMANIKPVEVAVVAPVQKNVEPVKQAMPVVVIVVPDEAVVEPDETVVVEIGDGKAPRKRVLKEPTSNSSYTQFDVFNAAEGMGSPSFFGNMVSR
jgi:hypothetical protein